MKLTGFHRKRALSCALSLVCLSSCSSPVRHWEIEQTLTCNPCYNSGKVYFPPCDEIFGLELELARGPTDYRMYLNIFSRQFPSEDEEGNKTKVSVTIAEQPTDFLANRFQGGQRLLLPDEAVDQIINALIDNQTVTIAVGRYSSEIVSENFIAVFDELNKIEMDI